MISKMFIYTAPARICTPLIVSRSPIIYIREKHFSSAILGLCNVGGVKCLPFLKHSNHWKRPLKMIFKGCGCFQFPEAVVTSTAKESLRSAERGSLQVFAVLYE